VVLHLNSLAIDVLSASAIQDSLADRGVITGDTPALKQLFLWACGFNAEAIAFRKLSAPSPSTGVKPPVGFIVPNSALKMSLVQNYYLAPDDVLVADVWSAWDPRKQQGLDRQAARAELGAPDGSFVIGVYLPPGEPALSVEPYLLSLLAAVVRRWPQESVQQAKVALFGGISTSGLSRVRQLVPVDMLLTPPAGTLSYGSFVQAVDVLVDIAMLAVGSRPHMVKALSVGTPVLLADLGLTPAYRCDGVFLYPPADNLAAAVYLHDVWKLSADKVTQLRQAARKCAIDLAGEDSVLIPYRQLLSTLSATTAQRR